jgi:hypothetical protein
VLPDGDTNGVGRRNSVSDFSLEPLIARKFVSAELSATLEIKRPV